MAPRSTEGEGAVTTFNPRDWPRLPDWLDHADTDRFLVLDVSRYKYPPVWVEADDLYAAMNTPDSDNQNRTRGFVLVAAKD